MLTKFIKNILYITIPTLLFCLLIAELVVFRFFIPASDPPGSFAEIPPTPFENSAFLRICRWSTVFRYLESNCDLSGLIRKISSQLHHPQKPPIYNANIDVEAVARERDLIRRGTGFLVAKIRAENPEKPIIFMMDAPRFDIYSKNLAKSNVWWLHEILRDACRANPGGISRPHRTFGTSLVISWPPGPYMTNLMKPGR